MHFRATLATISIAQIFALLAQRSMLTAQCALEHQIPLPAPLVLHSTLYQIDLVLLAQVTAQNVLLQLSALLAIIHTFC